MTAIPHRIEVRLMSGLHNSKKEMAMLGLLRLLPYLGVGSITVTVTLTGIGPMLVVGGVLMAATRPRLVR
jgi:hypothetical protein